MNVNIGQICKIVPKMTTAVDGNQYPVITVLATGRGWFNQQRYIVDKDSSIKVEVVSLESFGNKKYAVVHFIDDSGAVEVSEFVKTPYISKKTGISNPVSRPCFNAWEDQKSFLKYEYCSRVMTGADNDDVEEKYKGGKGLWIELKWLS